MSSVQPITLKPSSGFKVMVTVLSFSTVVSVFISVLLVFAVKTSFTLKVTLYLGVVGLILTSRYIKLMKIMGSR